MPFRKLKTVSFLIVLWLALLQAMAPLMHAHPSHGTDGNPIAGMHMHVDGDVQNISQQPSLKSHPVRMVGVDVGGSFSDDTLQLPPQVPLFLLAAVGLLAMIGIRLCPACDPLPGTSPTWLSSSPRAPPFIG